MPQDRDPLIEKRLGPYIIRAKLGEGGMARVYKAYHTRLRREDAIKVISSQVAHLSDFQARFEREAQLAASLEHPNIVRVYDFGEIDKLTYLSMQFVNGGTLRNQLRGGQPIHPARAATYTLQIARALHHAHQKGIVHRDVKPQNMLIPASDPTQVLLSDFGIAKMFDSAQEFTQSPGALAHLPGNHALTSVGQIVGTAQYMAPEQISGQPLDARTDVYALGIVLFQMLTGNVPFRADTDQALLFQQVHMTPPPVRDINPNVSETLAQITAKALEKAPEARFQSAELMAQALESALAFNPESSILGERSAFLGKMQGAPGTSTPSPSSGMIWPSSTPSGSNASSLPFQQQPIYYIPTQAQDAVGKPVTPLMPATDSVNFGTIIPAPKRSRRASLARSLIASVLVTVILTLLVWKGLPLAFPAAGPALGDNMSSTSALAGAFIDTFGNNHNNWLSGSKPGGLTATVDNGHYTLSYDNEQYTHFPYPGSVGVLPTNFTLTAQMSQERGDTNIYYGLAFRLTYNGNQVVSSYAFVINSNGQYAVLRYDSANGKTQSNTLNNGSSSAILTGLHRINELQAIVQGGQLNFMVNGQKILANPLTDATYTGGHPGLEVSGPNTSFVVTKVQLTIQ